jgi:hypothetical protein
MIDDDDDDDDDQDDEPAAGGWGPSPESLASRPSFRLDERR